MSAIGSGARCRNLPVVKKDGTLLGIVSHEDVLRVVAQQLDKANLKGTFVSVPERADVPLNANEQLVVELYSK